MEMWNVFDFSIVCGTNVGIVLKVFLGLNVGAIATVIRTFRVGRVFRLAKKAKGLKQLFDTLLLTIPSLMNILTLLFLIMVIFAVIGIQLFAKVAYNDALTEHANFRSFGVAMSTLLRASTGENWNGLMYSMARSVDGCVEDPDYDATYCGFNNFEGCVPLNGCGSNAAFPFMFAFTLVVTLVFFNVFIAVLLENFSDEGDTEVRNDILSNFELVIY